jgi:hypothetical protein
MTDTWRAVHVEQINTVSELLDNLIYTMTGVIDTKLLWNLDSAKAHVDQWVEQPISLSEK